MSGRLINMMPELKFAFPHVMIVDKFSAYANEFGKRDFLGQIQYKCRITGRTVKISDDQGNEQTSNYQARFDGPYPLTIYDKFTFPAEFDGISPNPVMTQIGTDEGGILSRQVWFK